MKTRPMTIRQAARWAESKNALYRVNSYTGEPEYLYALYDINTNLVECIGSYDKCKAYREALGSKYASMPTADGRYLRQEALDEVMAAISEEEGERGCIPHPSDAEAPAW